jgi:lambda repressor-like predicted transcriptional regulator
MALSKTQAALRLVSEGVAIKSAAAQAGIAESTLRMALGRTKNREQCPCCNQVVRAGFEIDPAMKSLHEMMQGIEVGPTTRACDTLRALADKLDGSMR